ncbi:hypothetical protein B0H14DRAFT_3136863 [Mycena olivaceomarginata]|nr:hypothetical protein B0H14DRAFT_3136863 [Mycena olivaceomarginata]
MPKTPRRDSESIDCMWCSPVTLVQTRVCEGGKGGGGCDKAGQYRHELDPAVLGSRSIIADLLNRKHLRLVVLQHLLKRETAARWSRRRQTRPTRRSVFFLRRRDRERVGEGDLRVLGGVRRVCRSLFALCGGRAVAWIDDLGRRSPSESQTLSAQDSAAAQQSSPLLLCPSPPQFQATFVTLSISKGLAIGGSNWSQAPTLGARDGAHLDRSAGGGPHSILLAEHYPENHLAIGYLG